MDPIEQAEAEAQRMSALRSYHLIDHPSQGLLNPASHNLGEAHGQDAAGRDEAGHDAADPDAPTPAVRAGAAGDVQLEAITRLAATIAGVPFASVNLIDEHHQHPLSTTGAPPAPIPRTQSLCATHFTAGELVHVPDLSRDPRYDDHPWVDGRLGALRSYTSLPLLTADGHALGTLCAIDDVPRRLDQEQLARLGDLAAVLVALFERHRDAVLNAQLAAEAEAQRALAQSLMAEQQHRAEQLAQLAHASHALATAEDPRTAICQAARRLTDADGVYLLQPDDHGHLVSTAVVGFTDDSDPALRSTSDPDLRPSLRLDLDVHQERGLPLATFRSGRQQFVADVAAHPGADPALIETLGTVSGAWQPILLRGGTCTGVLGIIWRHRREELDATLTWALHTLAREAAHTLERADLLAQLTEVSHRDPLTGVGNRRHWDRATAGEIARAERSGAPLTFALIDLDHFKAYNDAYGHLIGDDLLREFAVAASAQLRPGDTIARWGGEEFALALPGCDLAQAHEVADRIRAVVPHAQTATAGLAQWSPGTNAATVLARADAALYRGKRAGRNTTTTA